MKKKLNHIFITILLFFFSYFVHAKTSSPIPKIIPSQKSQGLYVSNTKIYISEKATLTVAEDLVIDNSKILGDGEVIMKSKKPQKINCKNASISKIIIDNPTKITLTGNLNITKKLTVKHGILDITQGNLIIDSSNVHLLFGASIYNHKNLEVKDATPMQPISTEYYSTSNAIFTDNNIVIILPEYTKNGITFNDAFYRNTTLKKVIPPPDYI